MDANLSQLVAALTNLDLAVRSQAAEQLSRLGPDAQPAAVALVQACNDDAEEVREWAVAALEELGSPLVTDAETLAGLLTADNADVGYWAATLLGRLGPDAAPVVPSLAAAVAESRHESVRQRAAWALGKIGPSAKAAVGALKKASASPSVGRCPIKGFVYPLVGDRLEASVYPDRDVFKLLRATFSDRCIHEHE
ncbi:MAG: HEAT repeat domain-containing protein [Candidatus Nealsonbacteria bacterium]|nr:HEAT repeat domain-containing protein [Candidatus Nealsonbacteria bacterium]